MPGFTWSELYQMPVDLRKFYYKMTIEKIKRQNKQVEEQNDKIKASTARNPRKK